MVLDHYNEFRIGSKVRTLPDNTDNSGMFSSNLFQVSTIYEIVDLQQGDDIHAYGYLFVIALLKGDKLVTGIPSRNGIIEYTRWINTNLIELVKDQNDIEWYKSPLS